MGGGASATGVVAIVGVAMALALAGCGGGSSPPAALTPQALPETRAMIKQDVDARLKKLGRPATEIACVDRNIDAMGVRQVAERIIEPAIEPPSKQTAADIEGPLGRGCH